MNTGLVVRVWNDAAIARRDEDGYANATAMCQANGKLWGHYKELARTQEYIQALAASLDLTPADLVITTSTGPNEFRGTWIHPRLAVDLARWISPEFAVWMDGWFLEQLEHQQAPQPQAPGLTAEDVVRIAVEAARSVHAHKPRPRTVQRRHRRVSLDSQPIEQSEAAQHLDLMRRIHALSERLGRISWRDFHRHCSHLQRETVLPDQWLAAIRDLDALGAGTVDRGVRDAAYYDAAPGRNLIFG